MWLKQLCKEKKDKIPPLRCKRYFHASYLNYNVFHWRFGSLLQLGSKCNFTSQRRFITSLVVVIWSHISVLSLQSVTTSSFSSWPDNQKRLSESFIPVGTHSGSSSFSTSTPVEAQRSKTHIRPPFPKALIWSHFRLLRYGIFFRDATELLVHMRAGKLFWRRAQNRLEVNKDSLPAVIVAVRLCKPLTSTCLMLAVFSAWQANKDRLQSYFAMSDRGDYGVFQFLEWKNVKKRKVMMIIFDMEGDEWFNAVEFL